MSQLKQSGAPPASKRDTTAVALQQSGAPAASKRDTTALALLGAMFLTLALIGSASLSAVGPSVYQHIAETFGIGRSSAIEAEQRRQAAALEGLTEMLTTVSADVEALGARIKIAENEQTAAGDRFALVDTDIAGLASEVRALRMARIEATDPAERAQAAIGSAHSDILALRSSLDDQNQSYRKDIGTVNKRLDRLEQMVSREATGSIRTQIRKKQIRRRARIPHNASTISWSATANPQAPFAPFGSDIGGPR
jgi:hypothetical protein